MQSALTGKMSTSAEGDAEVFAERLGAPYSKNPEHGLAVLEKIKQREVRLYLDGGPTAAEIAKAVKALEVSGPGCTGVGAAEWKALMSDDETDGPCPVLCRLTAPIRTAAANGRASNRARQRADTRASPTSSRPVFQKSSRRQGTWVLLVTESLCVLVGPVRAVVGLFEGLLPSSFRSTSRRKLHEHTFVVPTLYEVLIVHQVLFQTLVEAHWRITCRRNELQRAKPTPI
jgi:hypothetical protein